MSMPPENPVTTSVGLFAGLSPAGASLAARSLTVFAVPAGQTVLAQVESSRDLFLLHSGAARVVLYSPSGRRIGFREIGVGDMFGELSAIDGRPRSASVEAVEACQVARLPQAAFRALLDTEPAFAQRLLNHLVATNRALTDRVYEFSSLGVNNRIHAELLRWVQAGNPGASVSIIPVPTHEDIASRISTHREAVSRELSRLQRLGLIRRKGHTLEITDLARLRRMVEDATLD